MLKLQNLQLLSNEYSINYIDCYPFSDCGSAVVFLVYKAYTFKNKVEGAVVDGVKQAIVDNAPKLIDLAKTKLKGK